MIRLVDPIHFFDERGNAMGTHDRLAAENAELREQVRRLEGMLKAALKRHAPDPEFEHPTKH